MSKIKKIAESVLNPATYNFFYKIAMECVNVRDLITNTYVDCKLYFKHSMVFKQNNFNKIESNIILHYHSLEKGFLHSNFRYRFGEVRVKELINLLTLKEIIDKRDKSQIASAYLSICKYYEKHESDGIDISDYYSRKDYEYLKKQVILNLDIVKDCNRKSYFENTNANFLEFSNSRSSIRSFTGEKISFEMIENVIKIAKNAPSVCNRQPIKVYYVENKEKIDTILQIQSGLNGYTANISQLLIVVSDRNYYYTVGERNQLYVDGGIFLMNLLYALHYYKIAACPAHWGHKKDKDKCIMKELSLTESEKVICVIPIGIPKEKFKTTLSLRRENNEILKVV